MAATPDDFAAIPILMEPVADDFVTESGVVTDAVPATGWPARGQADGAVAETAVALQPAIRTLPGREAQQSLFDAQDLPQATPPPATRRTRSPPTLQRMAEEMLRARAPAIINELADEHARRLSAELRERLRKEMARLLAELAERDAVIADETVATTAENAKRPPL